MAGEGEFKEFDVRSWDWERGLMLKTTCRLKLDPGVESVLGWHFSSLASRAILPDTIETHNAIALPFLFYRRQYQQYHCPPTDHMRLLGQVKSLVLYVVSCLNCSLKHCFDILWLLQWLPVLAQRMCAMTSKSPGIISPDWDFNKFTNCQTLIFYHRLIHGSKILFGEGCANPVSWNLSRFACRSESSEERKSFWNLNPISPLDSDLQLRLGKVTSRKEIKDTKWIFIFTYHLKHMSRQGLDKSDKKLSKEKYRLMIKSKCVLCVPNYI